MADVAQADHADHPPALVDHRQPADLQRLHVMHRLGKVIILPAAMDAVGHHVARLGAAGIETVAGKPFADDVAIGHHPDQPVVLPDRNAADIVRSHQLCDFGDGRVGADPVDALVHRVFDFHGGPPLLRFSGGIHVMQNSFPRGSTIRRIGSAGIAKKAMTTSGSWRWRRYARGWSNQLSDRVARLYSGTGAIQPVEARRASFSRSTRPAEQIRPARDYRYRPLRLTQRAHRPIPQPSSRRLPNHASRST